MRQIEDLTRRAPPPARDSVNRQRLINWGYAAADAALRAHVRPNAPAPERFPYPAAAV